MRNSMTPLCALSAAVAVALAGALVSPAAVAGPFVVNPASNGLGGSGTFTADFVNGNSSALITSLGGNNYQSVGYIQYSGFSNNSSLLSAGTTGLNSNYGLYATFTQTFACPSALTTGTTCSVSTINLNVYADPGNHDAFTSARVTPTTQAPTVTDVGSNDVRLGTATLVLSGTAGIDALGGAFENVNTNFALTAAGSNYFIDPIPFYNFAFSNFNNSSGGVTCQPNCVAPSVLAVNAENGGSIFASVPEPGSVALAAIGFFSLAAVSRRRSKRQ